MRTQVFAYKGHIGILSDPKAEGLLNEPLKPGQLGFVVKASCVDISPEALDLLKKVPGSSDDIGEVDAHKSNDGDAVFSWLGGPRKTFMPDQVTASNDYHPELLMTSPIVTIPEDFIKYVDEDYPKYVQERESKNNP